MSKAKTITALNKAVKAVTGEKDAVFDRGDGIVLSLEGGSDKLDYYSESHFLIDTLVEIAEESGLVGFFETETPGAAIWYGDTPYEA